MPEPLNLAVTEQRSTSDSDARSAQTKWLLARELWWSKETIHYDMETPSLPGDSAVGVMFRSWHTAGCCGSVSDSEKTGRKLPRKWLTVVAAGH